MRRQFIAALLLGCYGLITPLTAAPARTVEMAAQLLAQSPVQRSIAIDWLRDVAGPEAIPALIRSLRYNPDEREKTVAALIDLAGTDAGDTWHDWMLWQQAHPEITPFEGHDAFVATFLTTIDPAFITFVSPGVKHTIRLEEIAWGGVRKDGIPALNNPKMISANDADYLTPHEPVFGISINGDTRAYPLRIMDWHEMMNDVVGGVPVALAYCTLCASGILFDTSQPDGTHLDFGSSGLLYRSNKLMYDQKTHSLWNQFMGRPVVGPLTESHTDLPILPITITTWADWTKRHPDTSVLALETGYTRDYRPGRPYGDYFDSPNLIFPALTERPELDTKDYVFALRSSGFEKAWALSVFEETAVINDSVGAISLTLIGASDTRSVRAYKTAGEAFQQTDNPDHLVLEGTIWQITEEALTSPDGTIYPRLPGHIAYWFAWAGHLGSEGQIATGE
ncbi:MAG: DUF3179 domain-containing protein [Parvibaculum sp.]